MTAFVSLRPPAFTQTPTAALSSCGIGSVTTVKPLDNFVISTFMWRSLSVPELGAMAVRYYLLEGASNPLKRLNGWANLRVYGPPKISAAALVDALEAWASAAGRKASWAIWARPAFLSVAWA